MSTPASDQRCPCASGDVFGSCCGPVLASGAAPTAVRLMRSRFTAFAVGDAQHLLRTWHPSTRPERLDLDDDVRWQRLDILYQQLGGPFDDHGIVEFEAFYRGAEGRGSLRERSTFVRETRLWLYVDGIVGGSRSPDARLA
ncbi:YchJ family protein [Microbacterium esteraromaticum]|uniref:YchJ family protein n=1 Tax=Microbacterium esteraromaticum TaxID=57043 RepID=UPI001959B0B0|nr:YchJ family metal-binding protein [Microbacterium esteraromaticum]MBM7464644.1 SEC-C motif-containing protein [Microbacterium esteraromaticum]